MGWKSLKNKLFQYVLSGMFSRYRQLSLHKGEYLRRAILHKQTRPGNSDDPSAIWLENLSMKFAEWQANESALTDPPELGLSP
jgi:hypothetical protein